VRAEVGCDPEIPAAEEIAVAVRRGHVTLRGTAPNFHQRGDLRRRRPGQNAAHGRARTRGRQPSRRRAAAGCSSGAATAVVLEGAVTSSAEHDAVVAMVKATPAVLAVRDELTVAGLGWGLRRTA